MAPRDGLRFKLRYVGPRFDGTRLPLDVIPDLPAFRNLVVAFAKEIWRMENKGRVRLPKGFEQALRFDLVKLEDGSAVPVIAWYSGCDAQATLPGFSGYLDLVVNKAFDQTIDLMDRAARGDYPSAPLTTATVRALDRFGAALRSDERIEFLDSKGRDGNVVSITAGRRREFLKKVKDTYSERVAGIGILTGLSVESGWIDLLTDDFGTIRVPLDGDDVHDNFDGNTRQRVQFDLSFQFGRNDEFKAVLEVHDVALVDEEVDRAIEKAENRLRQIAALAPGWNDGEGVIAEEAAINNVRQFIARRSDLSVGFKIYPTIEGGVLVEFEASGWDLSVEFLPNGNAEIYGVHLERDDEFEPRLYSGVDDALLDEIDRLVSGRQTTEKF